MLHYTEMKNQLPLASTFGKTKTNSNNKRDINKKVIEGSRYEVYKVACSFAIHTSKYNKTGSKNKKFSVPYIWTLNIGGTTFYGRTIEDFEEAVKTLQSFYELTSTKRIRLYVYKLMEEFQTMRKYFNIVDMFSADKRKPYYVVFDNGIELYDAHAMVDKSIENIAADLKIEFVEDKYNYEKRSSIMKLSHDTLAFVKCQSDIIYALIEDELLQQTETKNQTSIIKLPLTNTQRVRRHINGHCMTDKKYMKKVGDLKMEYEDLKLLKRCFTGGFTFANPRYTNRVIEDVTSLDIASAYPSIITTELFPMTSFKEIIISSYAEFEDFVTDHRFCSAFDITLYNLEAKLDGIFFLTEDQIHEGSGDNVKTISGKVFSADKVTISLTNIDWLIFSQLYKYSTDKIIINRFVSARAAFLPETLVQPVLDLYKDKTMLKGIKGQERQYKEAKVKLNSVYGMLVTDEVHRDTILFENGLWSDDLYELDIQQQKDMESLTAHNEKKSRTTFYGWGVWITAYARRRLFSVILKTADDFVYCDTDSVKVRNYDKYDSVFKNDLARQHNKILFTIDMQKGYKYEDFAPKAKDGEIKEIGAFEVEFTYSKFKALRSKQYVGIKNNELEVTCSGIPKKSLATYLMTISKSIDEAVDNFNFQLDIPPEATGVYSIVYIDDEINEIITDDAGNVLEVTVPSCTYYEPRGFSLSPDADYNMQLLNFASGQLTSPTF